MSLPLLLGGCGEKATVEPVVEVKPEELVAETKPAEAVSVSPHLKYQIKGDAVTITGCDKGASGKLVIPATFEGKTVTGIGKSAFYVCRSLTSITIPDSVTSIGSSAFTGCRALTSIEVGAGNVNYTEVNGVLFNTEKTVLLTYPAGKTGTNYNIPDGVTSIGVQAFWSSSSLTSITIPDSVTSIGEGAFGGCTSLAEVTFLGDAPKEGNAVFSSATPTIYRNPEAKGWGDTFADRPVKLISEKP